MRRTDPGRLDTTGLLPIVLGLLALVPSRWHRGVERSAVGGMALGVALVLLGIGQRRRSRPLVATACVLPASFSSRGCSRWG